MRRTALALLMAGAVATACVPTPGPGASGAPNPASGDTTVQGRLRAAGTGRMTWMVLEGDGGSFAMNGPMAGELANLQGATVRVTGQLGPAPVPPPSKGISVRDYTILSVGGEKPHVGVLAMRNGAWWLTGAETLQLTGIPADFAMHAGDKVFVVGDVRDGTLSVRSYGVLRRGGA